MSFFDKFRGLFKAGSVYAHSKRLPNGYQYVQRNVDPLELWQIIGELGDGAFGKVQKAQNKSTGCLAAAKAIELNGDDDMDSFIVEIEILRECQHRNVVGLYDAYYCGQTLWVNCGFGGFYSLKLALFYIPIKCCE